MSQFKYLGTTVTNPNLIEEKIKRRLSSDNALYHSVQNLLFSRLLSKNLKIRIYKTIILSVVLHGLMLAYYIFPYYFTGMQLRQLRYSIIVGIMIIMIVMYAVLIVFIHLQSLLFLQGSTACCRFRRLRAYSTISRHVYLDAETMVTFVLTVNSDIDFEKIVRISDHGFIFFPSGRRFATDTN
jgi:hypothetical protein